MVIMGKNPSASIKNSIKLRVATLVFMQLVTLCGSGAPSSPESLNRKSCTTLLSGSTSTQPLLPGEAAEPPESD